MSIPSNPWACQGCGKRSGIGRGCHWIWLSQSWSKTYGPLRKKWDRFRSTSPHIMIPMMVPGDPKWMWHFRDLVERNVLSDIKRLTNVIEQTYIVNGKRGSTRSGDYWHWGKFCPGIPKNNAHRIYLRMAYSRIWRLFTKSGTYRPSLNGQAGLCRSRKW